MDRVGRQRRIHIPNSIHHVMIRGNNRQNIFFAIEDFKRFLKIVYESTEKFDHKIIAYCLMSNHVHLLIHIHDSPLSSIMQKINYRYTRWVNYKEQRVGHLLQGRYRSLAVNDSDYLINLCRYIHLNPVEAKMVNTANDYFWSSHQYYLKNNCPSWMEIDVMLAAIKNKTNFNYHDFMTEPVDRSTWKPAIYIADGKIVFNEDVLQKLDCKSDSIDEIREYLTEDKVTHIVCNELQVAKTLLLGPSKNFDISKQRILLANYLVQYAGKNISDVAKIFHRTHGTVSRQLKKFNHAPGKYFPIEMLSKIEAQLTNNLKIN